MKRLLFLSIFFSILVQKSFPQWSSLNSGSTNFIWSIQFTSLDTGYTADDLGIIRKTINGGISWLQLTGTSGTQVFFPTPNIGYAIGFDKIRKTTNAGGNWNIVFTDSNITYPNWKITGINFPTSLVGYSVITSIYDSVKILKSVDAGANWNIVSTNITYTASNPRISFASQDTGYYFTDISVEKTTDGGNNWTEIYSDIINPISFSDIQFFGQKGFVLDNGGSVLKTINAGNSWNLIFNGSNPVQYDFCFINADTGYIAGGNGTSSGFVINSANSATNWAVDTSLSTTMLSVYFLNSKLGFAGGMGGILLKYDESDTTGNSPAGTKYDADKSEQISISPNPTTGKILINSKEKIQFIEIYNILGEIVFQSFVPISEINLRKQSNGIYFIIASTKEKTFYQKIIKQE